MNIDEEYQIVLYEITQVDNTLKLSLSCNNDNEQNMYYLIISHDN